MKKVIFLCIMVAIVIIIAGACSTKVNNCNCLTCEACDSLNYYAQLDAEAADSTWLYSHSDNFDEWYDSLTTLVVQDLEYHSMVCGSSEFRAYIVDEYVYNPTFMNTLADGWDGLCGDAYLDHKEEIDIFYEVLEDCDRENTLF